MEDQSKDGEGGDAGVVKDILQEMVDSVANGEGQEGSVADGPTRWYDQCLYECTKCGRRDFSIGAMKRHCRILHKDSRCQEKLTPVVYRCLLCDKELPCNYISIEGHVRGQHEFRTLTEYSASYDLEKHLAAVQNLSEENAASIRSAVHDEKPKSRSLQSKVGFS